MPAKLTEGLFPTLDCKCKNGHEWRVVIAKYWFLPECKICGWAIDAMRWGPLEPWPITNDNIE